MDFLFFIGSVFSCFYLSFLVIRSLSIIFVQVLLSQCHRFRALVLLGRFLDMGPWAVDLVVFGSFVVASLLLLVVAFYNMINFLFSLGLVCRNISICPEAFTNNNSRATTNSCIHMDEDSST